MAQWQEDHPNMTLLVRPIGAKPAGFDGRRATVVGRLTAEEWRQYRRSGLIDKEGSLGVRTPGPTKRARVRNRSGYGSYDVAVTLEDLRLAEAARLATEATAARVRQKLADLERERDDQWRARHQGPRDPNLRAYRYHEVPAEQCPTYDEAADEEDTLPGGYEYEYELWAIDVDDEPNPAEEKAWEALYRLMPGTFARWAKEDEERELRRQAELDEARLLLAYRHEIESRRAAGDLRFAPDAVKRCQNPAGCQNPAKGGRGSRCSACARYAQSHAGAWRPLVLVNSDRRRKGL